ncbi:hypothetical protein [Roseivirga misakiensis]|uniref:Lipocalin-like domain-containing protein n=1 Tax=Roseivirga misakiensis TaxID=1563681 RepID=A0A1E5T5C7_9BACT|nr:hypothetical protein [Roseivirga misakiensis]OEK06548.1 hypothetical protein BFP71_02435 [Roseivirga misakiensis]
MKKITAALLLVLVSASLTAQSKVREKDVLGEWDVIIDLQEAREEVEDDLEEEDSWIARRFARGISNFAFNIVESIDIRFDFRRDGELKMSFNVLGDREVEYMEWYINRDGELIIEDDDRNRRRRRNNSSFNFSNDDDVWMMKDGKLQAFERTRRGRLEIKKELYLKRR